ncbi:MAG: UvrD-helicase domain-containing protein [Bacteroidetes bacterium]|nr:UvrD-helicase domain-containing protein [Bacteroidota bacterium]
MTKFCLYKQNLTLSLTVVNKIIKLHNSLIVLLSNIQNIAESVSRNLLDELNEAQREAVKCTKGPVMVIAGAGSGKTRALTYRVAHLIDQGVDAFNILCLTFTNKAAREMKERIIQLVGTEARNVWMGTFHSVFARILRSDGHLLGYPSSFTIYDTDDSKSLLKNIVKEMDLDIKEYAANYVLGRISAAKSNLISAEEYDINAEIQEQDRQARKPYIGKIYLNYQGRLFRSGAMDFDDLLFNTNILLRDHPDVLYKYQDKFRYILVDEYQDTNYSQYIIVKKLASRFENICVVGDDAQSIYAFRGANIQNILNFKNDYPEYKLVKLEQNYRSTQNIVNAANSVIANNKDQIRKEVWTHNEEGQLIKILKASSDSEEGSLVANSIFETKMNNQLQNDAFVVLYRTNAQSRSIEEALRRLNIPYRIYGGLSFYSRKEIKDLLAYFRLAVNPQDEEALRRVINYPHRGIGETSMQKVAIIAGEQQLSLWEILKDHTGYQLGFARKTAASISAFCTMIQAFGAQLHSRNAFEIAEYIAKASGVLKELDEDKTIEGQSRIENIEALLNAVQEFTEREPGPEEEAIPVRYLDEFLQEVSLITDQDSDDPNDNDRVSLMTIHQAKGLEFPYVFITGLEENLFPSFMSISSRADLEEERRLFYVALTRAEKKVTISYAESRYRWGQLTMAEKSRFIDEIDEVFLDQPARNKWNRLADEPGKSSFKPKFTPGKEIPTAKPAQPKPSASAPAPAKPVTPGPGFKKISANPVPTQATSSQAGDNIDLIQPGMRVNHATFGQGMVISVEGSGPNKKASVKFDGVGLKQLLLRFAKLTIVN